MAQELTRTRVMQTPHHAKHHAPPRMELRLGFERKNYPEEYRQGVPIFERRTR